MVFNLIIHLIIFFHLSFFLFLELICSFNCNYCNMKQKSLARFGKTNWIIQLPASFFVYSNYAVLEQLKDCYNYNCMIIIPFIFFFFYQ